MLPYPVDSENIQIGDRVEVRLARDAWFTGTTIGIAEIDGYWQYIINLDDRTKVFTPVNGTLREPGCIWNHVRKTSRTHGRRITKA